VYFLFYPWLYEVFEVVQIKQQKMKKRKGRIMNGNRQRATKKKKRRDSPLVW